MAYTVIDDSSKHFQTEIYTGDGSSTQSITNSGNSNLQPDFVWGKLRSGAEDHWLTNSSVADKFVNANRSDQTESAFPSGFDFDSDGFSFGSSDATWNSNGSTYVAHSWKGNGGTTSTNTDGDIDTNVQVNSDAGFSIVKYSPPNDTARTIGHGLGAVPKFIIIKARSRAENGHVFHYSVGTGGQILDTQTTYNSSSTLGDAYPTSTVYKLGTDWRMNGAFDYIGYFFANVQGFSKFGTYSGNGDATDGPFVYLGFKPRFVILKNTETAARAWYMYDTARNPGNPNGLKLFADSSIAESTDQAISIYSNGFKVRPDGMGSYGTSSVNHSGQIFCYAAWAESPFVTSTGAPATAR